MKRIICWIIAFILPAACASADRYLEASFSFTGLSDNRIETIDLYEQDDQITTVSTLIPEYAVIIDQSMNLSLSLFHSICSVDPGAARENVRKADQTVREMIEKYLSDPVPGVYSGELFENASSVRTARFQLSDFMTIIINALDPSDDPFFIACTEVFTSVRRSLKQAEPEQEPYMELKVFDNWEAMSALLFDREQAIMAISFDHSSGNEKKILISYSENGRYYFRDILIKDDNDTITITSSLKSGTENTYQRTKTNIPLTAAQLTVKKEHFDLEMYGNGLSEPLIATGTTASDDNGDALLNAKVYIKEHDAQAINICISLSQMARPVNFSDKEMISISDQTDNAGFIISAASKATELAAEIIPTLPDEYQKMMIKLLYP